MDMMNIRSAFLALTLSMSAGLTAAAQFQEVTEQLGPFGVSESWGASWGDINSDGWPDLFLSNHRERPALFRNNGGAGFVDATLEVDGSNLWISVPWNDMHGGTWGDYDNDGDQDLFIATGRSFDEQLLENVGGTFIDQTSWAGVNGIGVGDGRHAAWLDVNNDGWLDLVSVNYSDNLLWVRDPGATPGFIKGNVDYDFSYKCLFGNLTAQLLDLAGDDRSELMCVNDVGFPSGVFDITGKPFIELTGVIPEVNLVNDVALGDFDGDLMTDIFALRGTLRHNQAMLVSSDRLEARVEAGANTPERGIRFKTTGVITVVVDTVQFWEGDVFVGTDGWSIPSGDGFTFILDPTDETTWGLKEHDASVLSKAIYAGYDPTTEEWEIRFHSQDLGRRAYVQVSSTQTMSDVVATVVNNAELPITPVLLRQNGVGFEDVTAASELFLGLSCVSAVAADFDNDMDLDLYLVCRGGVENLPNRLFLNQGDGTFVDTSAFGAEGLVGFNIFDMAGTGDSAAVADFNRDGFLDLVLTNGLNMDPEDHGGATQLFANQGNSNNWIELDLVGTQSNRDGIGAKVIATAGGIPQLREQNGGNHRWSQNHQRIHFGLANNASVDLKITWPSGHVDDFLNVAANGLYRVTENGTIEVVPLTPPTGGPGAVSGDECGAPLYDLALDGDIFIWKDCDANLWSMRIGGGGEEETTQYRGRISFDQPFTTMLPFSLEGLDSVAATNSNAIDYDLYLSFSGEDGVDFAYPDGTHACFELDVPLGKTLYVGSNRLPVTGSFDLMTLDSCGNLPMLSVSDAVINEEDANVVVSVTLSESLATTVVVSFSTVDGTAVEGQDYVAATGTLTFEPGETEKAVPLTILNDTLAESTESFGLRLADASGAGITGSGEASIQIQDDDTPSYCGEPSVNSGSEGGLFLWQDCDSGHWSVRVTGGGSSAPLIYQGQISFIGQYSEVDEFRLEVPWDIVDTTDPALLTYELGVQNAGIDGFGFSLIEGSSGCFDLNAPPGAQIFLGVGKVPAQVPFDLETVGACIVPAMILVENTQADENAGVMSFLVSLTSASSNTVTVDFATLDGTAWADDDYTAASGILTFLPGETQKVVDVAILDDAQIESSETFSLILSNPVGAAIQTLEGVATITDNDMPLPDMSVGDVSATEGDDTIAFTVTLSNESNSPVSVVFQTVNGSAQSGSDYIAPLDTEGLTFQPGETTKIVSVSLIDDSVAESTEQFYLELSNAEGANITDAQGVGTIIDDDSAAEVVVGVADTNGSEGDESLTFRIALSTASSGTVTVEYATTEGTALSGSDFTAIGGQVTFAPGILEQVVNVPIVDDSTAEETETFGLVLNNAVGASIGQGTAVGTITDDDAVVSGPQCGTPLMDRYTDRGVFIYYDCGAPQQWHIRVQSAGSTSELSFRGELIATAPFDSVSAVSYELPWDVLDTSVPGRISYLMKVINNGIDGIDFTLAPGSGVCFEPTSLTNLPVWVGGDRVEVTAPLDLTTLGACAAGAPVLSVADVSVGEAESEALVSVVLNPPPAAGETVTVEYATADASALDTEDYLGISGSLTFLAGETEKTLSVSILDDVVEEATESFRLDLTSADTNAASATVSIRDDDSNVAIACGQPTISPGQEAGMYIWQDCDNAQWSVWVTPGGSPELIRYSGVFVSTSLFVSVTGIMLELPWDIVDNSIPDRISYQLDVKNSGIDGFSFEVPDGESVCINPAEASGNVYLGPDKLQISGSFDLMTLLNC